jgi:hypothetical protein
MRVRPLRRPIRVLVARLRREDREDQERSVASTQLGPVPHPAHDVECEASERSQALHHAVGGALGFDAG